MELRTKTTIFKLMLTQTHQMVRQSWLDALKHSVAELPPMA